MTRQSSVVAGLLFGSGLSALVYQTVWLREFRLIFGASTFATAAVLAIFMAGLGTGSAILGRRADARANPLGFYGTLEILIALSALVSPFLLMAIRTLYVWMGGSVTLGITGATIVRLLLSVLVLGVPTFFMGGTLPAAARAVETDDDRGRRNLALLYATNTFGAVTGALVSTFYLLEHLGNRLTLFSAVALNICVGLAALILGRRSSVPGPQASGLGPRASVPPPTAPGMAHRKLVLIASATVGFAFLLMELVWYRMLTPLLGGTTFTFGLILAVALLGIGMGGAAYSFWSGGGRPSAGAFAVTCTLEALAIIAPFAFGDRLAVLTNLLRSLGRIGFAGDIAGWSLVTLAVVFPPAFISGIQFPILIALLGEGREDVGRDVGAAYAWNTAGAIAGSLAGGFVLMPLLTAPGSWRLVTLLLIVLAVFVTMVAARERQFVAVAFAAVTAILALAGVSSLGPTAAWRHTGIGAGRAAQPETINAMREWVNAARRHLLWDADGRESSIAVMDLDDRVFIANGKADGSARGDAGTQVMSGIIGALVHPNPRRALVIGLGTGSTAGWLAAVPTIEQVDVVELEPSVLRVARDNAAVNHDALRNPKLHVRIADAREVLLTTPRHYDLIFSEPSNPYRAGIASLYTREFYEAAAARLNRGGIFLQWVQAYDIDAKTIRTIYATMRTVFPHIDTWRTTEADVVLAGTIEPVVYDVDRIRRRLAGGAWGTAMLLAWRMESAEGFFSNFVGNDQLPVALGRTRDLNTDDRTLIEFGFARTVGAHNRLELNDILSFARGIGAQRPAHVRGTVDWHLVDLNRWHDPAFEVPPFETDPEVLARVEFTRLYEEENLAGAFALWARTRFQPVNSIELLRIGEVMAETGQEEALAVAERLRVVQPVEADALIARLRFRQQRYAESAAALARALTRYRADPWPDQNVMGRALNTAVGLARADRRLAGPMADLLSQPFSTGQWDDARRTYRVQAAYTGEGCGARTIAALRDLEPNIPWTFDILRLRRQCYNAGHLGALADRANRDWQEFESAEPETLAR